MSAISPADLVRLEQYHEQLKKQFPEAYIDYSTRNNLPSLALYTYKRFAIKLETLIDRNGRQYYRMCSSICAHKNCPCKLTSIDFGSVFDHFRDCISRQVRFN